MHPSQSDCECSVCAARHYSRIRQGYGTSLLGSKRVKAQQYWQHAFCTAMPQWQIGRSACAEPGWERVLKTHLTEVRAAPLCSVMSLLQLPVKTLLQLPTHGMTLAALPPHGRQLPVPGCMLWRHRAGQHPETSWLLLLLPPAAAAAGPAGQRRPQLRQQGWWAGPAQREPVVSSSTVQVRPLTQQANAIWRQRQAI